RADLRAQGGRAGRRRGALSRRALRPRRRQGPHPRRGEEVLGRAPDHGVSASGPLRHGCAGRREPSRPGRHHRAYRQAPRLRRLGPARRGPVGLSSRRTSAMARIPIAPPDMKDQRPRYTLGWRVGNTIYVAGQLPYDKDGNLVGVGDIRAQTRRIFENIRKIVEAGGGRMDQVVKVTVFVTDVRYPDAYAQVPSHFFAPNPPPRPPLP